jgi:DNA-directed RNA polymerase subunit alpha
MDLLIQRFTEAAKVLIHHFMLFSDERITRADEIAQTESYDEVIAYETIA